MKLLPFKRLILVFENLIAILVKSIYPVTIELT